MLLIQTIIRHHQVEGNRTSVLSTLTLYIVMATAFETLTNKSTNQHFFCSDIFSSASINLPANPRRRYAGAQVTAVTWPCQFSPFPEEILRDNRTKFDYLNKYPKDMKVDRHCQVAPNNNLPSALPIMYPIKSPPGDSATRKYSGHLAKYCK